MPSLKYRSAPTEPLAPFGFGSHKLDGVRFYLYRRVVFAQINSPPLEGWQAQPDGVVASCLYKQTFIHQINANHP